MKKFLIILQILLSAVMAFSQNGKFQWGKPPKIDVDKLSKAPDFRQVMDALQLEYTPTNRFTLQDSTECFNSVPLFARVLGCLGPQLKAKDGEFVAYFYYDYSFVMSKYDSLHPSSLRDDPDTYHLRVMKRDVCFLSPCLIPDDFSRVSLEGIKKYVHYYPSGYARKLFRADTVISYPLTMKGKRLHGKYNHADVLILQRNHAGMLALYCFYTDKGYARRDRYRRRLGRAVRFKEPADAELFIKTTAEAPVPKVREVSYEALTSERQNWIPGAGCGNEYFTTLKFVARDAAGNLWGCCNDPDTDQEKKYAYAEWQAPYLLNDDHIRGSVDFRQVMDALQLEYTSTRGFVLGNSTECFDSVPHFARRVGCLGPELKARDGEFVAYCCYDYSFVMSKYDSLPPSFLRDDPDTYHLRVMKGNMCFLSAWFTPEDFRRISLAEIKKRVYYYPSGYARKLFHADTVISYPLTMKGKRLHGKYNYADVLILQRNHTGMLALYCFYTDKGYARRDRYRRRLGRAVRFKEPADEL